MSVLTHKEATTRNPAARPRKLEDLSRWQEQLAIRKKIETELRDAEAADRLANGSQQTPEDNRVSRFIARLWAKVSGATAPIFTEADEVTAAEKLLAVRRAMEQQQRHMESLRHELSAELSREWEPKHFAARQRIARAAVELAEAVQDEQATATQMYQAGALLDPLFGRRPWINVAQCPLLPQVFRAVNVRELRRDNANLLR